MKTFTTLFIITLFTFAYCQEPQIYCGRRLADTLQFLCESVNMVKRSGLNYGLPMKRDFEVPNVMKRGSDVDFPWLAPSQARALGTTRGKRQIISECCDKPCTIDELLTYC